MSSAIPTHRSRTRHALLAGVSISALAVGSAQGATPAGSPRVFSPAWFAARVDSSTGRSIGGTPGGTLGQVTTAQRNLATIATRLAAMQAAQQAAAKAAISGSTAGANVPDGLVLGGLQPAAGAAPGAPAWTGANLPTEAQKNGRAEVTVQQTAPQAMLTWQTFNVGRKTDLAFNQSAGGSNAANWVVLNRVEDPAAQPTQILGSISAPGKVYVINANGILFGAGSQINLGALIASTADISATQFLSGLYGAQNGAVFTPTFTNAAPDSTIVVQQGAEITTTAPASVTTAGGYVMLLAGSVSNSGQITTPDGQTVLASGQNFTLRPGYSTSANQTATVQGSQVASCFAGDAGCVTTVTGSGTTGTQGTTTNAGLITATLGDITLVGHNVVQSGVVLSTTSVNTRGTVHLLSSTDPANLGNIVLAPGSVTSIAPDNSATTALDSQRQSLLTQSAANNAQRVQILSGTIPVLNDVGTLPDLLDESRVEITTGGFVQFDDSSLTMAQGGQIAVQAGHRVWVGNGATLDVSGATGAVLPMSSNVLTVNIQGNELRDAPVNRDTTLITSRNVSVDINSLVQVQAGTNGYSSTRYYTQGGLLEVSGYLNNVGHTIDEWAALGGQITFAAGSPNKPGTQGGNGTGSVVTQPGALINISGGAVTVQSGYLPQSYLIGPGGALYNVNTAPANLLYSGVYSGFTVNYQRFGGTDSYTSSVATPSQIFESGYTYGRDAGSVTVEAPAAVLEAAIIGGVTNGAQQSAARPANVTDGYTLTQSTIAQPGTLAILGADQAGNLYNSAVLVSGSYVPVADSIQPGSPLPDGLHNLVELSANQLSAEQLGGFSAIAGTSTLQVTGPIDLAPGGTLSLIGATVDINAGLSARGGRITIADIATVSGTPTILQPPKLTGGITIAPGTTIDLRGEFTNAITAPTSVAGEALVNGGTLSVDSASGLSIGRGSLIDASSGGALLPGNKQRGGTGGSVTLIGDDPNPAFGQPAPATAPVSIGATLRDYGVNGGGTLTLTAPSIIIGGSAAPAAPTTVILDPGMFQTGFSDYVINGFSGLTVAPGTALTITEPVYTFYGPGSGAPINAPTGQDPAAVFQLILPPTYSADQANGRLSQRKGASLEILSNDKPGAPNFGGGAIDIGAASAITVDPGQSVRAEAFGQITDDGAITARGGSVALVNEKQNEIATVQPLQSALSLSIWVGSDASINVAGLATTALDQFGRPYGVVTQGGTIVVGSDPLSDGSGGLLATDANVLIRPGAVLDAAGADATIDLLAGTAPRLANAESGPAPTDPINLASNGGVIILRSYDSIEIGGTLNAAAGGAGAQGGALAIGLEDPIYFNPTGSVPAVPNALRTPRVVTVSQNAQDPLAGLDLAPGAALPGSAIGQAHISQQLLSAGGFDTLSLYARDVIAFDGNVALALGNAVTLSQGIITDLSPSGTVSISAPYVALSGAANGQTSSGVGQVVVSINGNSNWKPYAHQTSATFTVNADLIDLSNKLRFGLTETYPLDPRNGMAASGTISQAGFAQIVLNSTGDIRFDPGTPAAGSTTSAASSLTTPGNVTFAAAQVYPTTGAAATVLAGFNDYAKKKKNEFSKTGTITILGNGATPAIPYSVGGSLALYAGTVIQDGILRAPEGQLTLGAIGNPNSVQLLQNGAYTYSVVLMPGSITSVSLDGATIPYGGTVDGVSYTYNGVAVGGFTPSVTLGAQQQTVDRGALLDLSGGGTLAGAGFITGRGGSTNVLTGPFLQFDAANGSVTIPTLAQDPVYAIVPGYASGYAPLSPVEISQSYGSVPSIGSQITIGAGVPGIAPGTYTLLPSYYALLPGAARVQIATGVYDTVPGVTSLGAGSYQFNATTSVANTGFAAARPVEVLLTTAAGVALNSQYNQESFSQFEIAQAANFGTPRVSLPEDGKTLNLWFPAIAANVTALNYAGQALFGAAAGGYAGQVSVGSSSSDVPRIEITADGATPTRGFVSIDGSALDALAAPRLIIGGGLQPAGSIPSQLNFVGEANEVVIRDGAVLTAPEIFLTATSTGTGANAGAITVEGGATLSTIGQGAPPFDTANAGFYYNANGYSLVALSNGQITFTPYNATLFDGAITIADGASLLTSGTLNFATTKGLSLGATATFGARYLSLEVANINVVSDAALAAAQAGSLVLPSGFTLTQTVLNQLLQGNPQAGTPALQTLTLTADDAINFAGSVALNTLGANGVSTLQDLVLNTPAIYGYGAATDAATLTTGTLYWNGIETRIGQGTTSTPGSKLPGGVVANGPGTGTGTLNIVAQNIVFGYGPNTEPDSQTTLDRLIEGFGTVNLTASNSISANSRGALSVYQAQGASPTGPGTGGTLNISTPLLTGDAGSVDAITAGGVITIAAPNGGSTATAGALGAELDLTGSAITDTGVILLNAGRLTMTATSGDLTIGAGARIDLAGETTTLVDQAVHAGGGSAVLTADTGSVVTDPASSIDVSATGAAAGALAVNAPGGTVDLGGTVSGGASAGEPQGSFSLSAGQLNGFDAINTLLDAGNFYAARSFEIASGDLTIDQTVKAASVSITTDAGSLTVTGTIDASGNAPGSIALNAGGNLTIADGALLDAHGNVLQADSTGAAIEAENRASISLATTGGTLTLGAATLDLAAPVTTPLGQLTLIAPRSVVNGAETGDVAIDAAAPVDILGAATIALYGSRTYTPTDANGTIEQHTDPTIKGSVSLDQINADNVSFIAAAATNATLIADTAGLRAYGAYQLHPADVIQSSAASNGNLTVNGDLDLSGYRYGAGAGSALGAGAAGMLTLRAADNLTVNGSITDGFAPPPDATATTPDDNGWQLYASEPLGQAVTLPVDLAKPITVVAGTAYSTANNVALNYGITIDQAHLNANVVIPTNVVTAKAITIGAGGVTARAQITAPDGSIIATPGQILPAGTIIPSGSTLGAGTVLPNIVVTASGTFWPAGASLSLFKDNTIRLHLPNGQTLALQGGAYIPPGTTLVFANGKTSETIRGKNAAGVQGLIYATASLLPPGSQSWALNLVGGANLASANLRAVQPVAALAAAAPANGQDPAGSIVLADTHYTLTNKSFPSSSFSVIRTGTGDLSLVAGGNIDEASLYGVYTAGTQTLLGSGQDAAYNPARAAQPDGTILGKAYTKSNYNAVDASQQASYPDHGGNLLIAAQNNVTGDVLGASGFPVSVASDGIGDWLWRQGGSAIGQSTSWWINFGSYVLPLDQGGNVLSNSPVLTGFTGFGALGGGNVSVIAGGDAGEVSANRNAIIPNSQSLVVAVASTGRVSGASTILTGGGALTVDVAGTLNPASQVGTSATPSAGGTLTDMRGDTTVTAGQVGRIDLVYNVTNATDPRALDPFATQYASSSNGLIVVPGDGTVTVDTMRDLVIAGAGDATRETEQALTAVDPAYVAGGGTGNFAGYTGFSLWTDATAIALFSAGGNLTPTTAATDDAATRIANDSATDLRFIYPAVLDATAASGSFYYGANGALQNNNIAYSLELAPAPSGELSFLAAQSIYAHGYAIDMSGANAGAGALATPLTPAYTDDAANLAAPGAVANFAADVAHAGSPNELFAFEEDTTTTALHANDPTPARIYAAGGDLVDVVFGEVLNFNVNSGLPNNTWYLAAKPADIYAGRDIVSNGVLPGIGDSTNYAAGAFTTFPDQRAGVQGVSSGSLLLNLNGTDISTITAGRDILGSYYYVAGPGQLQILAGRNIDDTGSGSTANNQLAFGVFKSVGAIIGTNSPARNNGASIAIIDGAGSAGPDDTAFAELYFNNANQADLALPLTDPANAGKVQQTYEDQLYAYLQATYAYQGPQSGALAYFLTLPSAAQGVFVRSVFFDELAASATQEADPTSLFYRSYTRGRTAIATLFPATGANQLPITYDGAITMDSGTLRGVTDASGAPVTLDAGISTLYGGSIQILSPGGADTFGSTGGPIPGASSGVITQGAGNVDIYALGSVLLGQSRIFTTFGGSILIWSAEGDINAGRGAKTTTILPPPLIAYDLYGGITLAPPVPTSGAGIATISPIAGIPLGNVDLVAPVGTVDAGEAGIRVAGNLVVAAARVGNQLDFSVGGKSSGNTATVSVNVSAATSASAAVGSATNAATSSAAQKTEQQALQQQPSIITVEILNGGGATDTSSTRRRPAA